MEENGWVIRGSMKMACRKPMKMSADEGTVQVDAGGMGQGQRRRGSGRRTSKTKIKNISSGTQRRGT